MIKKINKIKNRIWALLSGMFWFSRDFFKYRAYLNKRGLKVKLKFFPRILDKDPASHTFDKHYVYMDRWAFINLLKTSPKEHIDVGSSIRFLSMASAITKLKFVDIRPVSLDFNNYECITGSILQMPFEDSSVASLSCLHVAEHIGLGRYGDPLDVLGTKKACKELTRILAPGGRLYFALPVGKEATYFNAHRVHSPKTILEYFSGLKLLGFSAVGDDGHYKHNAKLEDYYNDSYACGMFEFTKQL